MATSPLLLLLNADAVADRLGLDLTQPTPTAEVEALAARLSPQQGALLAEALAALLEEAHPELAALRQELAGRHATRGVEADPTALAALWEAVKENLVPIGVLVFYLRTLGHNRLKGKVLEYEGSSIFQDLAALLGVFKRDKD